MKREKGKRSSIKRRIVIVWEMKQKVGERKRKIN